MGILTAGWVLARVVATAVLSLAPAYDVQVTEPDVKSAEQGREYGIIDDVIRKRV